MTPILPNAPRWSAAALLALALVLAVPPARARAEPPTRPRPRIGFGAASAFIVGTAWAVAQLGAAAGTTYAVIEVADRGFDVDLRGKSPIPEELSIVAVAGSAILAGTAAGAYAGARYGDPYYRGNPIVTSIGAGVGTAGAIGIAALAGAEFDEVENWWLIPTVTAAGTLGAVLGYELTLEESGRSRGGAFLTPSGQMWSSRTVGSGWTLGLSGQF